MKNKVNLIALGINLVIMVSMVLYFFIKVKSSKTAEDIFEKNVNSIVEVKASTDDAMESFGTGVIYDSNGLLITNAHIISYTSLGETKTFDNYQIRFLTKEDYQSATLIKYDVDIDLAILKIDDDSVDYNAIVLSNNEYSYGEKVYAIGNTSNYGIGISEGIISVPLVNVKYDDVSRLVIQANIDVSSGNSGGALLDEDGELIGITTFRIKDNQGNINYGFTYCITLETVKKYISEENI